MEVVTKMRREGNKKQQQEKFRKIRKKIKNGGGPHQKRLWYLHSQVFKNLVRPSTNSLSIRVVFFLE